jgi:DNA-binding response OmpR family regulator
MKRIVVIEDEPNISELVRIILEAEGHQVITFNDAALYQSRLQSSHPDLVLLDLNIAGFDGQVICDYIKKQSDLKHIPVILMSANQNITEVKKDCGAEDFINKPFDVYHFLQKVNAYT